jgi:hypothetical protein
MSPADRRSIIELIDRCRGLEQAVKSENVVLRAVYDSGDRRATAEAQAIFDVKVDLWSAAERDLMRAILASYPAPDPPESEVTKYRNTAAGVIHDGLVHLVIAFDDGTIQTGAALAEPIPLDEMLYHVMRADRLAVLDDHMGGVR